MITWRNNFIDLALLGIGLLTGCSSIRVNTDYAEGTDFSNIRTFKYQNSENTVENRSPLAHQRIVEAIRSEITASGFEEVEDSPDVFVNYSGSVDQQLRFDTTYSGVNTWHRTGRNTGVGFSTSTTRTTTVTEGTLVIDIWDAESNALIWRAVATSPLSSRPDRNAATIRSAVEKAFEDFPPVE